MFEMGIVLGASGILILIAHEFTYILKREWGENSKSFF